MITNTVQTTTPISTLTTFILNSTANHTQPNETYNRGGEYTEGGSTDQYLLLKKILFSIIFILSVTGNGLILASILLVKRLRRIKHNYLIFQLSLCDILNVCCIPTNLIILTNGAEQGYPFNAFGCKTVWPLATYAINASALTLICLAVDRYLAINSIWTHYEKKIIFVMIAAVQLISLGSVVPYSLTLTYTEEYGFPICYEEWYGSKEQKAYTLILFVLQYGVPFVLIVVFYTMAWWGIMRANRRMIQVSEEYERKITWDQNRASSTNTDSEQNSSVSLGSEARERPPPSYVEVVNNNTPLSPKTLQRASRKLRNFSLFHKPKYISQTAYVRHRQTIKTLKMFTIVVVVFAVMALPNQILWLIADFKPDHEVPKALVEVAVFITYSNAIINCWVYGGYNKHFRRAYKEILLIIFPCFKRYCSDGDYQTEAWTRSRMLSVTTYSPRNDTKEDEDFSERQRFFSAMFDDHLNNSEKYQHLYNNQQNDNNHEQNECSNLLLPPKTSSRKTTLSSLLPSTKTNQVNNTPPALIMTPPIIPFMAHPMSQKRRVSTSALETHSVKHNNNNALNLKFIETDNLVPIETLAKDKKKTLRIPSKSHTSAPTTPTETRKRSFFDLLSPRIRKVSQQVQATSPKTESSFNSNVTLKENKETMENESESETTLDIQCRENNNEVLFSTNALSPPIKNTLNNRTTENETIGDDSVRVSSISSQSLSSEIEMQSDYANNTVSENKSNGDVYSSSLHITRTKTLTNKQELLETSEA